MRMGVIAVGIVAGGWLWAAGLDTPALPDYLFTAAPQYQPDAWTAGRDRFPAGATLMFVSGRTHRPVAPGFYAAADGAVSFDGTSILFAARRTAADHWRIWESPVAGGTPRALTPEDADCIRPFYLPDARIVYTRVAAGSSDIEVLAPGDKPVRLTFAPGRYLTAGVLRDGRILFETGGDIFTVYPDGTGVETFRCDHGQRRSSPRQVSSGDIVFNVAGRLARFTSARAEQLNDVPQPGGEPAGPIAEVSPERWLVSLRRKPGAPLSLVLWNKTTGQVQELETAADRNAVEPAVVRRSTAPPQFPSALVPTRTTGNLLCLNARESKTPITGDVRTVRVYTKTPAPALLGQAPVEPDGSFYVEVPADSPIRLELLNAKGEIVRAESGWFWMRPSEQRVCVGCHAGPERAPDNRVPAVLLKTTIPVKLLGRQP